MSRQLNLLGDGGINRPMTVYISPNPGKEQAADTARRAAHLLLMQGAVVLMRDDLKESCYEEGVQ